MHDTVTTSKQKIVVTTTRHEIVQNELNKILKIDSAKIHSGGSAASADGIYISVTNFKNTLSKFQLEKILNLSNIVRMKLEIYRSGLGLTIKFF